MKKQKKVLALVLCAVMLVASSVLATMAYLTSTTNTVNNTFTVGNVGFDQGAALDETDVDVYGVKDGETRVTANKYKLIPGHTYTKDPQVHMSADTEAAWLFVKVVNPIAGIEANDVVAEDGTVVTPVTIAAQMEALGWSAVEGVTGVYKYKDKVTANQDITVFNSFTVANDVTLGEYDPITVQAYAVQADGFATAADAWTNAPLAAWQ